MNSQKVTVNTQGKVSSADGAVLVKGEHYNVLRDDVAVNEAAIAVNAAAIGAVVQYSGALTDGAPKAIELTAAIGLTPGLAGAGWQGTVLDVGGTALLYHVASDGTNWWYTVMTAAV
jgi:hypothetical protein